MGLQLGTLAVHEYSRQTLDYFGFVGDLELAIRNVLKHNVNCLLVLISVIHLSEAIGQQLLFFELVRTHCALANILKQLDKFIFVLIFTEIDFLGQIVHLKHLLLMGLCLSQNLKLSLLEKAFLPFENNE